MEIRMITPIPEMTPAEKTGLRRRATPRSGAGTFGASLITQALGAEWGDGRRDAGDPPPSLRYSLALNLDQMLCSGP